MMNVWTRFTWNNLAAASFVVAVGLMTALPVFAAEHEPPPDPPTAPGDATPTIDEDPPVPDASPPDDDPSPTVLGSTPTDDEGPKADKPTPPGQLVRRGIFGTVLATGTDDEGNEFVILETKFGNVTVNVEDSDDFGTGDRFTALLDRSPVPSDATETTDGSFRTVTALRAKSIPGKASRSHLRSVVVGTSSGTDDDDTLTILDDDGNEIVLENDGASGTLDGEDTILLIRGQGLGPPVVVGGITSFSVQQRLERVLETASPERLAKFQELIEARQQRLDARLQRLEDKAPAGLRAKIQAARDKSKGQGRGASGGDGGDGGGKGKPAS